MKPWAKTDRRQRQPGAHQHRRPDHRMESRDVLADQVHIGRPPVLEPLRIGSQADCRRVVDQRVEPDVDDALGVPGQRNAPRLTGPADGDVVETAFEQPELLVTARLGHRKLGMLLKVLEQRLLVLRQPEEIVLLLDPLRLGLRMLRAAPVHELFLGLEGFASDAVPPFVDAFVDVAGVVNPLHQFCDRRPYASAASSG